MNDVLKEAMADAQNAAPTSESLTTVENLIQRQLGLEDSIEELEETLKQRKKELDEVRDKLLPDAMMTAGVTAFETKTGMKVKVETQYFASVTKDKASIFYDWLDEHNHGGIIDSNVMLSFGKGGRDEAKAAAEQLKGEGFEPQLNESIHWATLRAFAREQIEEGNDLPPELSVHQVDRAKIKRPKE